MDTDERLQHAIGEAHSHLECIVKLVAELEQAESDEDDETESARSAEDIRQEIYEYPLELSVRFGWHSLGMAREHSTEEYRILLSTGWPLVELSGLLDQDSPLTVIMQAQDWNTPLVDVPVTDAQRKALLAFAQQFDFYAGD